MRCDSVGHRRRLAPGAYRWGVEDAGGELTPAQREVLQVLGARPNERPEFDPRLRDELRAELEERLAPLVELLPDKEDLWLGKRPLADVDGCEGLYLASEAEDFAWTPRWRWAPSPTRPSSCRLHWRGEPIPGELVDEAIARLSTAPTPRRLPRAGCEAERAELRSAAGDRVTKFFECFPPLEARWRPVTESRSVDLFDGRILLRGKVDLTLGRAEGPRPARSSSTSRPAGSPGHRDDLRFYALLDTMRLGVPPRLVATFYLDGARPHARRSPRRSCAAPWPGSHGAEAIVALRTTVEPGAAPGTPCRWCPRGQLRRGHRLARAPGRADGLPARPTTTPGSRRGDQRYHRPPWHPKPTKSATPEHPRRHGRVLRRSGPGADGRRRRRLADPRRSDVDEWGRSERMRAFARQVYDPIYRHWFRVEWEGLEKIPTDGGALLVANHAGAIPSDAPAIMHGIETELSRPVYGLADDFFSSCPSSARCGPASAACSPTPTTPTACCASRSSSSSSSPRAPRARARPTASATSCAASAAAASSRSPCGPACRSSPSPWSAPRSRCRSSPSCPRWPSSSASPTSRSPPTCWPWLGPLGARCHFPAKFKLRVLDPVHFDVAPDQARYTRSRIMDESEADPRADPGGALRHAPRTRRSVWFG